VIFPVAARLRLVTETVTSELKKDKVVENIFAEKVTWCLFSHAAPYREHLETASNVRLWTPIDPPQLYPALRAHTYHSLGTTLRILKNGFSRPHSPDFKLWIILVYSDS
jgi:hypothetical protein